MRLTGSGVLRYTLAWVLVSSVCLAPGTARDQLQAAANAQLRSPQQQSQQQQELQQPDGYAISVTVPVVNVDVVVTDNHGKYLTGLSQENFRITEDGVRQQVTNFSTTDAPITVVLLVEYSRLGYGWFVYNARNWASVFLQLLKPNDWVAMQSFSLQTKIEVDFTHDPLEIERGLIAMNYPPSSESNLFDALVGTIDRLEEVQGRKSILVLASGLDTFSKLTLGKTLERLKESDVTINSVGVAERFFMTSNSFDLIGGQSLNYLQAQNQLRTFAKRSGGRSWFPRFDGEIPDIMTDVAASLRNQYSLAYTPSDRSLGGEYRKIKVELVNADGSPLVVNDEKGKKIKFQVYAREGYQAPKSNI